MWVGWAFHWRRYATINSAAHYFAAAFAIEAVALLLLPAVPRLGLLQPPQHQVDRIGLGVILFAVTIQPIIGPLLGRSWAGVELFGLVPDPTVAATLGILLVAGAAWALWIIPLLWCLVSGATLWTMEAREAGVLPAVAVVALVRGVWNRRRETSR